MSHRNQSIDLHSKLMHSKSMDWFLYDNGLRDERVKSQPHQIIKYKQFVGKLPTICLSVFDDFVGLLLKGFNICRSLRKQFPAGKKKKREIAFLKNARETIPYPSSF